MTDTMLIKNLSSEEIASRGTTVYEKLRANYEPVNNGKFLAIEPESENVYLGETVSSALLSARAGNPGKVFFIVKIGFDTVETMAQSLFSRI